ncbi:ABC transporter permease [Treponema sp. OMZ 840]|uniref:ABC transporter permease n=1 Tax=Treponema sp. OMZ 840 TaxID=244313 RepID=UPI003D90842F
MELNNKYVSLKRRIENSQWILLCIVIVIISVITASINPKFFRMHNIMNIFEQISVLGLVSVGATIIIISGNFDISVGALIGLTSCVMAIGINNGINPIFASLIGIALSICCTTFNGILSIIFKAPSFIISLATTSIYTGIALFITKGVIRTVYGQFDALSVTKVFGFIPLLFIISLIGYILVHIMLSYTQIGRRLFALGANERAAYLAGIDIIKNKLLFFAMNGFFVGIASMLLLSRVGAALPSTGKGYELQAMGAVVIGGVSINGGKGNVIGSFFGVLLMGLISNALNILGVNPYLQEIASGTIIILSLGVSAFRTKNKTN